MNVVTWPKVFFFFLFFLIDFSWLLFINIIYYETYVPDKIYSGEWQPNFLYNRLSYLYISVFWLDVNFPNLLLLQDSWRMLCQARKERL